MSSLRRFRSWIWDTRSFNLAQAPCGQGEEKLPPGLLWRALQSSEELQQSAVARHENLCAKFEKRLAKGSEICLFIQKDSQPVYFLWASTKDMTIPEIGFARPLPPNTGYIYHGYTWEAFRGLGLHTLMMKTMCYYLARRKIELALVATEANNHRALKAHARAGFKDISFVRGMRVLGVWRQYPKDWFGERMLYCQAAK